MNQKYIWTHEELSDSLLMLEQFQHHLQAACAITSESTQRTLRSMWFLTVAVNLMLRDAMGTAEPNLSARLATLAQAALVNFGLLVFRNQKPVAMRMALMVSPPPWRTGIPFGTVAEMLAVPVAPLVWSRKEAAAVYETVLKIQETYAIVSPQTRSTCGEVSEAASRAEVTLRVVCALARALADGEDLYPQRRYLANKASVGLAHYGIDVRLSGPAWCLSTPRQED